MAQRAALSLAGLPLAGLLGAMAWPAHAQEAAAAAAREFSITPDVTLTQTFTDNLNLGAGSKQGGSITQLSPRLRLNSNGGRVKGVVDYSLDGLLYTGRGSSSTMQQSLDAAVNVEAIENRAYVDLRANIGQQSISAFGPQSVDANQRNGNQTQVSSFRIEPSLRGELGALVTYDARANYGVTHGSDTAQGNSTSSGGSIEIGPESTGRQLSWSADASSNSVDYSEGRPSELQRARASLIYAATPELKFSGRYGREINNITSDERQGSNTPGWGMAWNPSERTKLTFDHDRRFFGSGHMFSFEHRTPRTVWRFSDTRDTTADTSNARNGTSRTIFDLLYTQFASVQPDPAQRANLVNAFLQANGIRPSTVVPGGFLSSAVTLQRRQDLSLALMGLRTTVIVSAMRTQTSQLDPSATTGDISNGNALRQHGFTVDVSHRLTPLSSLSLSVSQTRSTGDQANQSSDLQSIALTWSSRLSERINVSLGGRHSVSESTIDPYTETAIIAIASLQF